MLAWIDLLFIATLALFVYLRYRAAESRSNFDVEQLRDDLDGVLRRESKRVARERAALRRNIEDPGDAAPDSAPPSADSSLGGVVREASGNQFQLPVRGGRIKSA